MDFENHKAINDNYKVWDGFLGIIASNGWQECLLSFFLN